jgi:hypothetical protein
VESGQISQGNVRTRDPDVRVRWDVYNRGWLGGTEYVLEIALFSWSDAVNYRWGQFKSAREADRKGMQVAKQIATAADREAFRRGYKRGREYAATEFQKSDERIDEASEESFPASDPPSH